MRRHIAAALLSGSLLSLASAASAADIPVRKALPPPPPVFSWSGLYIGVHIGSAWSTVESNLTAIDIVPPVIGPIPGLNIPVSSHNINGFLGGVQAGYNWQLWGSGLFGIETQWSWSNIDGTTPCIVVFACTTETKWVGTLAARLGFTVDRALIYVKGGVAWAKSDYSIALNLPGFSVSSAVSDTRVGGMWGAGVEYAFAPNWSAKIEYNYIDFRNESYIFPFNFDVGIPVTVNAHADIEQKLHLIKFGINYRLGDWFGKAPVAARY
jgi:outer membrane immunogenic protein